MSSAPIFASDAGSGVKLRSPARSAARNGYSLRAKLLSLVVFAVAVLVALQVWALYTQRDILLDNKRTEILSIAQASLNLISKYHEAARSGKMSEAEAQRLAAEAVANLRYGGADGKEGYTFIFGKDARYQSHGVNPKAGELDPKASKIGAESLYDFTMRNFALARKNGGVHFQELNFPRPGGQVPVPKINVYVEYAPWEWLIGTGMYIDDIEKNVQERAMLTLGIGVVLIGLLLGIGWLIVRNVTRQIGDDPRNVISALERAAAGDLTQTFPNAPAGSILAGFGATSAATRSVLSQVREEASAMKRDANRIAESVAQVSTAASAQSEATSSVAAAVEQLTVSVGHISEAALETQRNSENVTEKCRASQHEVETSTAGMKRIATAVGQASDKIGGLASRAEQISAIAASIKEIASQTNLLALNAAIEAARAGEHGRGFSVVADEVRKLAERTASATVEIEETVGAVQRETRESTATMAHILPMMSEGASATEQVARALNEIGTSADVSLERVREVAHATREQSSASTSIAQQVESIAQMVEQTTAAMGETARSADEVSAMAGRLDELVARFKV
ncbi:methyl-accepting chemotaxis protein [Pigmentiphaga aceris]|uniref:Methyl-accepting chemotaxis protein n=1 Tax=Pigmentiphaga aceris TaxID=1940612 RepID=A0A5C0AYQ6_9BURK|nr:methyl-accepting chemotaxis protein [Pigmentiphaga aceris]QEI07335.1 methyl-accepting chemotaxis protein [Pigmentiphaga aceris]